MFLQPCLHPAPRKGGKSGEGKKLLIIYFFFEHVQIPYQGSIWKKKNAGAGVKNQLSLPTGITKNIVPRKGMFKQNSSSKNKPKHTEEISLTLCVKPRGLQRHLYPHVRAYVCVWRTLCYCNHSELRPLSDVWTEGQMVTWVTSSKHGWKEDKSSYWLFIWG